MNHWRCGRTEKGEVRTSTRPVGRSAFARRLYDKTIATAVGVALALTIAGCATEQAAKTETPAQATANAEIAFFDSRIFDDDLSRTMRKGPSEIKVNIPAGFNLNDIPDRIDRWLYSVKDSGGRVIARRETPPGTRGIVSAVIDVVVAIFERADEARLYAPTEKYDATLLYGADGTVKEIVFAQR